MPSPIMFCSVSSLDLQYLSYHIVMYNSFLFWLLLYNTKCAVTEFGCVVCGGLEKYPEHKINVSKHFTNAEE